MDKRSYTKLDKKQFHQRARTQKYDSVRYIKYIRMKIKSHKLDK